MQVQVNVKAAANRFKKFVEAAGGTTKHSDVLELMAEVCGFDSYRALQAASAKKTKSAIRPVEANTPAPHQSGACALEHAGSIVFSATAVDWQLAGNPGVGLEDVPEENRTTYDFIVEQDGSQFRVLMKPVGINLDNFDGRPVLDMLVEVNEGLPCVHLTNDPSDIMLATVFATGQGLLIREDGGDWMRGDSYKAPDVLVSLAKEVGRGSELHEAHLAVLDTAEKYREYEKPPALEQPEPRALAVLSSPHARTNLIHPVRRQHLGSYVEVKFEPSMVDAGKLSAWVKLFDEEGVCGDEDALLLLTRFTASTPDAHLGSLAAYLAQLTAFFIEGGYDTGDLAGILNGVTSAEVSHLKAEHLWAMATNADTREEAYELVTAMF